jgi:hypothetical protein
MSSRIDFTEEEWELIATAPLKVATLAGSVDNGAIADTRELLAYPDAIVKAYGKYRQNELIFSLLDDENFDARERKLKGSSPWKHRDRSFNERITNEVAEAEAILARKAELDAPEYRTFLLETALEIINASGEGLLGAGARTSPNEAAFLEKLRELLHL